MLEVKLTFSDDWDGPALEIVVDGERLGAGEYGMRERLAISAAVRVALRALKSMDEWHLRDFE